MDGIFISYRRDDSAGYAGRLYDRLAAHFGSERVFMDVEGIEPGADFVDAIEAAVSSCRVLIVIIGNAWIGSLDAGGRRRLEDPNDFVRLETAAALKRGIRVVPVLVEGSVMPHVEELPADIKSLARRQAIEISHKQWDASTGELIRTLEALLADTKPAPTASTTPATTATVVTDSAAPPVAADHPGDGAQHRSWTLPLAVAIAAAGVALWFGLSQRDADAPIAASKPEAQPQTKPAPQTRPETAVTAAVPETPAVALPKPAPPAVVEPRLVVEPRPVAPPEIRSFRAESAAAGVRLCYRVSNADSLTLSPRPGELEKRDQDCVSVAVGSVTTFTLTARNADKVVRKTLAVAPTPRVAAVPRTRPADPAAASVEPAPASAEPAPAAVSALPVKGERWVYRTSGKWPTSPKRQLEVIVRSVANDLVTDALRVLEPASAVASEERRSRGKEADFIAWSSIGPEFAPYFGAFVDLAREGSWSGMPTPELDGYWRNWFSTAKVIGRESVSVPAGSFDSVKLEVWSNRSATGGPGQAASEPVQVHYLIWYAAQAKRYVKMQRRIISANRNEGERDTFELVSHRLP